MTLGKNVDRIHKIDRIFILFILYNLTVQSLVRL